VWHQGLQGRMADLPQWLEHRHFGLPEAWLMFSTAPVPSHPFCVCPSPLFMRMPVIGLELTLKTS
jgi:hypothetical protein